MAFALGGKRDLLAKLAATAQRPRGAAVRPSPSSGRGEAAPVNDTAPVDVASLHPLLAEAAAALHAAAAAADVELRTVPGRGRGAYARRPFAAGDTVLTERPFAWLRWRDARGDDRRYPSLLTRAPGVSDQRALAAFLLLAPNAVSSSSSGGRGAGTDGGGDACATVWDGAPSLTRRGDVIVPAIHRNGFQVELPPPHLPNVSLHETTPGAPPSSPPQPQHLELLLLLSAMLNHSCEPNVAYSVRWAPGAPAAGAADEIDAAAIDQPSSPLAPPALPPPQLQLVPEITFTALRPIAAGEELCHAYTDVAAGVADRRARLAAGYGFTCACAKCAREAAALAAAAVAAGAQHDASAADG